MHVLTLLAALAVLCLCSLQFSDASWLPPLSIKGQKFFDAEDNTEFRIKGVAYYPRPNAGDLNKNSLDYFTDEYKDIWMRDLPLLEELGVNTVRIYSVDPTLNHDAFFCELSKRGMYAIIGMATQWENQSIPKVAPPDCYFKELYERAMLVYNAFAVYDNVLGFSVGNENNHGEGGPQTVPCVKAMIRDIRAYAKSCGNVLRKVPIGLFIADGEEQPRQTWIEYYDCVKDNDKNTRPDWFGLNTYIECDVTKNLEYDQSEGYKKLVKDINNAEYSNPFILGEYGCIEIDSADPENKQQRPWRQTKWMHEAEDLTKAIVGGVAFEYSIEKANVKISEPYTEYDGGKYGMGYFTPEKCDDITTSCKYEKHSQFDALAAMHKGISAPTLKKSEYTAKSTIATCPSLYEGVSLPPKPDFKPLACASAKPMCDGDAPAPVIPDENDDSADGTTSPPGKNNEGGNSATGFSLAVSLAVAIMSVAYLA